MPYSLTTQDGITLQGIPDDMAADHPDLKARVAAIRGQPPAQPKATPYADQPTSGIAMGLRDPVDALAQVARRIVPDGIGKAVDTFGNWLADKGLPVARSDGVEGVDHIVKGVNAGYEQQRAAPGQSAGFDWSRMGGNMLNPANWVGGGVLKAATTLPQLAIAGAKAGAVSGVMQPVLDTENFLTEKAKQAAAGAAGGAVITPVAANAVNSVGTAVARAVAPKAAPPTDQQLTIAMNNILASQGMKVGEVPDAILLSVANQVKEAMTAGAKMNPAAMMRKAQFEAVGLTGEAAPTAGQMTRDPMQFANEKNLSGVRLDRGARGAGNDLADRFQAQNNQLGKVFDRAGASGATDRVTAGQTLIDALKKADEPIKAAVDGAYQNARSMTGGRAVDLERGMFTQSANDALDKGMLGRFVPENIRGLLNDITEGKTPFNVDAAVQIDGILSAAQRKFGAGSPEHLAVGKIRDALHATPLAKAEAAAAAPVANAAADAARTVDVNATVDGVTDVTARMANGKALPAPASTALATDMFAPLPRQGTAFSTQVAAPAVDEGAAAREAFDQARKAARTRFATIEQTPALQAALDNAAPDKFVQHFVLGADVRDVQAMRNVLENSPEALDQARAQVADHLKRAAFGENVSGDKAFAADRYLKTLQAIGKQKLEAFFSPAEIVQLNLAGKVASDINSIPAGAKYGTNTSGTGAAIMNLLSNLGGKVAGKVPVVGPVLEMVADKAGAMKTQGKIEAALKPAAAPKAEPVTIHPEVLQLIQKLLPGAGVAAGATAGASAAAPVDPKSLLPPGSKAVGTSNGRAVYQAPNGKRYTVE